MNAPQATHPAHPPLQPLTLECAICGYDIHDNPGGRCPECGATAGDRREWLVRQGWRQPRWILSVLGWIVILSIAMPLLAAVLRGMAEVLD